MTDAIKRLETSERRRREADERARRHADNARLALDEVRDPGTNTEWALAAISDSLIAIEARLELIVGRLDGIYRVLP